MNNHHKRYFSFLLPVLVLIGISRSHQAAIDLSSPVWTGTKALRHNDYQKALEEVRADTSVTDTVFRCFKLGCIHQGLANWGKALFYFRLNAQLSEVYAPYAYERIGDIELSQQRFESALLAYRVAANKTEIMPYRYTLYRKMYSVALHHADTLGKISWLEEIVGTDTGIPDSSMKKLFRELVDNGKSLELDSALQKFIDPSAYNKTQCFVCSMLSSDTIADTLFSTKTLYLLSKLAYSCKEYNTASNWLHKAFDRKDFNAEVPLKDLTYHQAVLNYRMKNYGNCIKWGKKYDKLYGHDPTLIYYIARSYRNLGKNREATHWYDVHILLFPYHTMTHDIVWYRAWQMEDANNFTEARRFYKILFNNHSGRTWGDDACFRYALSYCKECNYASALNEFSFFLKKYPSSPMAMGARYWKAKCFFARQLPDLARKECENILLSDPTNYYAFRARELYLLLGDTIPPPPFMVDTSRNTDETLFWLDSIMNDSLRVFTERDSAAWHLGTTLAAIGMLGQAEQVLEPFEVSRGSDLLLQYQLAQLYSLCNDPTRSYRVAKRLSWRIPSTAWLNMPIQIYAQLYPLAFMKLIRPAAEANNIEPELVCAVIRQESVFDPEIESPVGAIGLMQIMPYTGEEIARDLKEPFVQDSLYNPTVNIRYGTYYIKKILNQLDNNIILAIAGYNGGPHNAKKWRAQNNDDGFDMFVEDIGFSETRNYVKKVLGNYWTYKELKKYRQNID